MVAGAVLVEAAAVLGSVAESSVFCVERRVCGAAEAEVGEVEGSWSSSWR